MNAERPIAPAYREFHAWLYLTTEIDRFRFSLWVRDNRESLRERYLLSEDYQFQLESNPPDPWIMDEWLRLEYTNRAKHRANQLPLASAQKEGGELSRRETPGPVGSRFAGMFRRDQHRKVPR